jgi:hypothetical protein
MPLAASMFVRRIVSDVPEMVKDALADRPDDVPENTTVARAGLAAPIKATTAINPAKTRDIPNILRPPWPPCGNF